MQNNLNKMAISVLLGFVALSSWAQTCIDTSRVQTLANYEGRRVAKYYDGGNNLRVRVVACDYNEYSGKYSIEMHTYWDGTLSGKVYNVDGILEIKPDGSSARYRETYSNQNLKDWVGFRTGMSVLGAIIENSSNYSR